MNKLFRSQECDTQRSEAIHNLYSCIRNVINPVSSIVAGSPIMNGTATHSAQFYLDNAEEAQQAVGVLSNKLADFAIYFDEHTYKKITAFIKATMGATGPYLDSLSPLVANNQPAEEILAIAEQGRSLVKVQFESSIRPAVAELIGIFRAQLGIARPNGTELPT